MNKTFVLAWFDVKEGEDPLNGALQPVYSKEEISAYPEGGGGTNIRAIFCSPDGIARHAVQGWWPADRFREECERGLACAKLRTVAEATELRAKDGAALVAEAEKLAAANPEEMGKPIRESAIARRVAALKLRATAYEQMNAAIGQDIQALCEAYAEDGEGRVIK